MKRMAWWKIGLIAFGALVLAAAVSLYVGSRDAADSGDADILVVLPTIPPEQGACFWLDQVSATWPLDEAMEARVDQFLEGNELPDVSLDDVAAPGVRAQLAPVRALIERALACSTAPVATFSMLAPSGGIGYWNAGRALELEVETHARAGRGDLAVAAALDVARLGALVARGPGTLISYQVGLRISLRALHVLRRVALRTPCDPAVLESAARTLEGLEVAGPEFAAAMRGEYTSCAAVIDDLVAGRLTPGASLPVARAGYWFHPNQTKRDFQAYLRPLAEDADKPLRDARSPVVTPIDIANVGWTLALSPNSVGEIITSMLMPVVGDLGRRHRRFVADQRGHRVMLALIGHRARHGALPATLAELGGAVPRDPYDGEPLRYDAARRLVWVVGEDFADTGGTPTALLGDDDARWESPDPGWELPVGSR